MGGGSLGVGCRGGHCSVTEPGSERSATDRAPRPGHPPSPPHIVSSSEQWGLSYLQALEWPRRRLHTCPDLMCSSTQLWRPPRVLAQTTSLLPPCPAQPAAQPQGPACDLASALQAADVEGLRPPSRRRSQSCPATISGDPQGLPWGLREKDRAWCAACAVALLLRAGDPSPIM